MAVLNLGKITDQSCVNIRTETVHRLRFLFLLSHLLYGICVNIFITNRYISKSCTTTKNTIDLQYACRAGAAVVSTITSNKLVIVQEYPTEPLDKIPALQAEFELAGKKTPWQISWLGNLNERLAS